MQKEKKKWQQIKMLVSNFTLSPMEQINVHIRWFPVHFFQ